ncbi:MAG: hypothetical protein HRT35_03850 [Algicola sp.]|nr:hypothetical protein [Algicola sp.]
MKMSKKIPQERTIVNVIFAGLALMSLIASMGVHHDSCDFKSAYPQGGIVIELAADVCAMVKKG